MDASLITGLAVLGIYLTGPIQPVGSWTTMRQRMHMAESLSRQRHYTYIEYRKDKLIDFWQTPEQTRFRKSGDCEDMAIYDYFNEDRQGEGAFCVGVTSKGQTHACMVYLKKYKNGFRPAEIRVKDRTQRWRSFDAVTYFSVLRPIYFISNDEMYLVEYRHTKKSRIGADQ